MLHDHPTRTLLTALFALLVIGALTYILGMNFVALYHPAAPASATDATGLSNNGPAPTPKDYVAAQKGFQYIVSYTDTGFVPRTLAVKKGETVRFTNNSGAVLNLSLAGAAALVHGAYFEYTFTQSAIVNDGSANRVQVTVN